jgi:hypothetical protein
MSELTRENIKRHLLSLGKTPNAIASSLLLLGIGGSLLYEVPGTVPGTDRNPIAKFLRYKEPRWSRHLTVAACFVNHSHWVRVSVPRRYPAASYREYFLLNRINIHHHNYDPSLLAVHSFLKRFYAKKYPALIIHEQEEQEW